MEAAPTKFTEQRRRPNWAVIIVVALLQIGLFYVLLRAFAPETMASVERSVLSTFSVTITAPPPPPPPANEPMPDEGAAGEQGKKAVPKPVTAPPARVPAKPTPVPKASSTGAASSSGAKASGDGTGASGSGLGTGSGNSGGGQGGVAVSKPVKIAGDINSAADFAVPAGGRQARFGNRVVVYMTVGTDGRATNCRVTSPSPDAEADRIVCRLAEQRFRFRPATDANGNPVPSTYGWQQKWFAQ